MNKKLKEWEESKPTFDFNEKLVYQQMKRNKQKVFFKRVLQVCTCCLALIFVLVNTSHNYIKATKDIPLLNNINEFLSLNKNMLVAIENDYIQELNLSKKDGDFEVKVEYMVVDEKSVYVFFNSYYKGEKLLDGTSGYDASISINTDKEYSGSYSWYSLDNYDCAEYVIAGSEIVEDFVIESFDLNVTYNNYQLDFLIDINQNKISKRKVIDVNQTIDIQGQKLEITKIEVYPLSMRIFTRQDEQNDCFIENVRFNVEINNKKLDRSLGLTGIGDPYGNVTYIVSSPYFIDDNFEITLSTAELITKPGIITFNTQTHEWNDPLGMTTLLEVNGHDLFYQLNVEDFDSKERPSPLSCTKILGGVGYSGRNNDEGIYVGEINLSEGHFNEFEIVEFELNIGELVEVNKKVKLK